MEYVAQSSIAPGQKTPVESLLRNALFGEASPGGLRPGLVGQTTRTGCGFNQGQGALMADIPTNPWNFVLALAGGVAWAAGLYRRQGIRVQLVPLQPFHGPAHACWIRISGGEGFGGRSGEIWLHFGIGPTYREVRNLLRKGRASVDGRPAQNGLEFAEAACMLGVDRGISGFLRYNLLKRRGDSYIALPVGCFEVKDRSVADLVRELNGVLDAIDQQVKARQPKSPACGDWSWRECTTSSCAAKRRWKIWPPAWAGCSDGSC